MRKVTLSGLLARKLRLALTALAIVVGVMFITGTLILGDTLNRTFNDLIGTAYGHVSFEIRGKAVLDNTSAAAVNGTENRKPVPESLATEVSRVPGVAYVHGSVQGYAQFLDRSGNAIGGGGGSTLGFSFDPNRQLSPYRLVEGTAPTGADDVVMDKATATKHHFAVGDRVLHESAQPGADVHDHRDRHLRQRRQPGRGDARRVRPEDRADGVQLARLLRHDQRPGGARVRQREDGAGDRQAPAARRARSSAARRLRTSSPARSTTRSGSSRRSC